MKPLPMNLKNAKKVDGDQHSSVFDIKGHRIQIMHKLVSPLQRKQLEGMPIIQKMDDGGEVENPTAKSLRNAFGGGQPDQPAKQASASTATSTSTGTNGGGIQQIVPGVNKAFGFDDGGTVGGAPDAAAPKDGGSAGPFGKYGGSGGVPDNSKMLGGGGGGDSGGGGGIGQGIKDAFTGLNPFASGSSNPLAGTVSSAESGPSSLMGGGGGGGGGGLGMLAMLANKGGTIPHAQHLDSGGGVLSSLAQLPTNIMNGLSGDWSLPQPDPNPNYAPGWGAPQKAPGSVFDQGPAAPAQVPPNQGQGPTVDNAAAPGAPQMSPSPSSQGSGGAQQNAPNPDDVNNINVQDIYKSGKEAINAKYGAEANLAEQQAQIEKQNALDLRVQQSNWDAQNQAMKSDLGSALQDVSDGHINSKAYLENMGAGQKVGTAIGLILGGIGGGLTHGPNPALQFLQSQIDRDIEAQKSNQQTKLNVYNGYLNQYKDSFAAEQMTRATQMGIYASKIRQAADQASSPIQKANGLMAANQLEQQMLPLVNNAHLMHQVSQFNGTSPDAQGGSEAQFKVALNAAQVINPGMYKDMQEKYVPGIGMASHPVEKADAQRLSNLNSLIPLIDKAVGDQQGYGMSGAWSVKNRADAASDQQALQVKLNELTGLNRLNDAEYKNYGQQIGNIGGINAGGTLETLKNLRQQAETDRNSHLNNMGITPFTDAQRPTGLSGQEQQILNMALKQNPGRDPAEVIQALRASKRIH